MKDVTNGELQVGIGRVPKRSNGPLSGIMNLEQFEKYIARVPIQPPLLQNRHERDIKIEHEFQVPKTRVAIHSGGQLE